ncbi:MAG: hypothetical protein M0R37_00845 [Bacteroidales bacterium]|nr:hypothetical protein [Bacteroidales bacterium]
MASLSIVVNNNINLNASFKGVSNYFTFDSASDIPEIKNALLSLLNDCATRCLLENNFNIYGKIPIVKTTGYNLFAFGTETHSIKWNVDGFDNTNLFLIHELFHAYQHGVGYTEDASRDINTEIEAFMAEYKYAVKYGLFECLPGTADKWEKSFGAYLISPTSENYDKMINHIRNLQEGAYQESEFPDDVDKRNINNISTIFNCY